MAGRREALKMLIGAGMGLLLWVNFTLNPGGQVDDPGKAGEKYA